MEQVQIKSDYPEIWQESAAFPNRKKFLVVEDDLGAQLLWERIIDIVDPKAVIRWATSEEGAEKLIRERARMGDDFDIVVTDVLLAGEKTGIDLWKRYGDGHSQFLFVSGIGRRKFTEMTGKWEDEYPLLMQKPLNAKDCILCMRAMLSAGV